MYTSRLIGVGRFQGNPIASFTLASRSIPYRRLGIDPKGTKINVFPLEGYGDAGGNENPEVDNYACLKTGHVKDIDADYIVAFNGHMTKRVTQKLDANMRPDYALHMVLGDFFGMPSDARIGGCAYRKEDVSAYIGVNDSDQGHMYVKSYPDNSIKNLENMLLYVFDKDTSAPKTFALDTRIEDPTELAEYIHNNIIGEEIKYGLGTGVAYMNGDFKLGVYNTPDLVDKIEGWNGG